MWIVLNVNTKQVWKDGYSIFFHSKNEAINDLSEYFKDKRTSQPAQRIDEHVYEYSNFGFKYLIVHEKYFETDRTFLHILDTAKMEQKKIETKIRLESPFDIYV